MLRNPDYGNMCNLTPFLKIGKSNDQIISKQFFCEAEQTYVRFWKENEMNLITNTDGTNAIFMKMMMNISKNQKFHEKMKFPKLIKDHSEMIPGGSGHQKTWFWMAWSLPELRKIIKNGKLKNWKSKCFYFEESDPKAVRFRFQVVFLSSHMTRRAYFLCSIE